LPWLDGLRSRHEILRMHMDHAATRAIEIGDQKECAGDNEGQD
jgi:hypothetical protein